MRHYLITAFREITKEDIATGGIVLPPYPSPKNLAELKKNIQYLEETRDANAALNLKRPRGRKRSTARVLVESFYVDVAVTEEMERGGKGLEAAIGTVADKLALSDRTVSRARKIMKQVPSPKVDDSK